MNVVLTGFMGSGKSAVGRCLAQRLGWSFFDTDEMIERDTHRTIAEIFNQKGEALFRDLESKAVALVSMLDQTVIATGGGVPLKDENMRLLEKNGAIFCLTAKPESLLQRLGSKIVTRPLLKGRDPLLAMEDLLKAREKSYRRCTHRLATDDLTVEQVADRILKFLPHAKTK